MKLLVGLGNPGTAYTLTRHNMGFMAADEIIRRYACSDGKEKFKGLISAGTCQGEKILVLKPHTFMNLSGDSVLAAATFYKIKPADIFVFHDDMDLTLGQLKVKVGGGSGGHNGLKSIDANMGPAYHRVRIGIGHPASKDMVTDFVLGRLTASETSVLTDVFADIADCLPDLLTAGDNAFMNKIALKKKGRLHGV